MVGGWDGGGGGTPKTFRHCQMIFYITNSNRGGMLAFFSPSPTDEIVSLVSVVLFEVTLALLLSI